MADERKKVAPEQDGMKNEIQEKKPTAGERFTHNIVRQFEAEAGTPAAFDEYERILAQHLFLCVDAQLKELETKRASNPNKQNDPPLIWDNVNMLKLALDAVHRVKLGLDGLVKAHIYPVPYLNGRTQKYDLDLRIGYRGKDYYRRKVAVNVPIDIRYELVHETDHFVPKKKDFRNEVEGYEFEIKQPFDRGEIVGGFAYLMFEDPSMNVLVLVSEKEFMKSKSAAKSQDFWSKYPEEMRFKTLVHRATDHLPVDPMKVNGASFSYVEAQDDSAEGRADRIAANNANGAAMVIDGEFDEEPRQAQPAAIPQQTVTTAPAGGPDF